MLFVLCHVCVMSCLCFVLCYVCVMFVLCLCYVCVMFVLCLCYVCAFIEFMCAVVGVRLHLAFFGTCVPVCVGAGASPCQCVVR